MNNDIFRLSNLLIEGFSKVASVIETNKTYDDILGEKLKRDEYKEIVHQSGKVTSKNIVSFLYKKSKNLKFKRLMTPDISSVDKVLTYASTANNLRELEFFARLVNFEEHNLSYENINSWQTHEKSQNVDTNTVLFEAVRHAIYVFFTQKPLYSLSLLHQSVNFIACVFQGYYAFKNLKCPIFVIANDHSPKPVAFTKLAAFFGMKTCYLQHAEVTENFPALDFNFSILRNRISKDTYTQSRPTNNRSRVFIASRVSTNNEKAEPSNPIDFPISSQKVTVVIYLSSVYDKDEVKNVFELLNANPSVTEVFCKLHPSDKEKCFFKDNSIAYTHEKVERPHVAICGNSSVVVELIKAGNLVLNFFGFDSIPNDYYGFVASGLTFEVEKKALTGNFWRDFNLENFNNSLWAKYDPDFQCAENDFEKLKLATLRPLLFNSSKKESLANYFVDRDIFFFEDTFRKLMRKGKCPYQELWLIKRLDWHFQQRNPKLNKLFASADLDLCESIYDFWLNTKTVEWTGYTPNENQLQLHIDFIQNIELSRQNRKLLGWLETKLFDVLLRHGDPEKVSDFLENSRLLDVNKIGINKKIAFLNYVNALSHINTDLNKYLDLKNTEFTPLEKLKVAIQADVYIDGCLPHANYKEVQDSFTQSLPNLCEEFNAYVKSFYDQIYGRDLFVDVKRSKKQKHSFISQVKEKLLKKEGFSFIRLSDGEAFIFQGKNSFFSRDDCLNRQRHWWGVELPVDVETELRDNLKGSVSNADVLGVPSIYRFLRDHSNRSNSLLQNLQGRGLVTVLSGLIDMDLKNVIFGDDKLNIAVLNDIDVVCDLARYAKKVIMVNSGSLSAMQRAFGDMFDFEHVAVPTHFKTATNKKYMKSKRPLPFVWKEINAQLEKICEPGCLVLVGAGVAGKIFLDTAKSRGSVALDLGSAMDQYIGGEIHSLF